MKHDLYFFTYKKFTASHGRGEYVRRPKTFLKVLLQVQKLYTNEKKSVYHVRNITLQAE